MRISKELAAVWMICAAGQGSSLLYDAVKAFGSPEEVYEAEEGTLLRNITEYLQKNEKKKHPDDPRLIKVPDIGKLADKNLLSAESYVKICRERGIRIIPFGSEEYPTALRSIENPPCALFMLGNLSVLGKTPAIAIVGTRESTDEGNRFAASAAYELSTSGLTVISGLAKGIDTYAHKGALLAGCPTVAVIAGSVDNIYPKENAELYRRILEKGAIVSEYLPDTPPHGYMFHMRNRLISALSGGVLVVESRAEGGSMITVTHAQEQGRPIYAVPGFPGRKESEGTNQLIRRGALLVTCAKDIIDDMNPYFDNRIVYSRSKKQSEPTETPAVEKGTYAIRIERLDEVPLSVLVDKEHYTDEERAAVKKRITEELKIIDVTEPDYHYDPEEILDENGNGTGKYRIKWERPFEECKNPETPEELENFIRYSIEREKQAKERERKAKEKERLSKEEREARDLERIIEEDKKLDEIIARLDEEDRLAGRKPAGLKKNPSSRKKTEKPEKVPSPGKTEAKAPDGDLESEIYRIIRETGGATADDLCRKTGNPFPKIIAVLGRLAIEDFIKETPGGIYRAN